MTAVTERVGSCDGFPVYGDEFEAGLALRRHPCRLWMRVVFCSQCGLFHVRRRWD